MKIKCLLVAGASLAAFGGAMLATSAEANISLSGSQTYKDGVYPDQIVEVPIIRDVEGVDADLDRHGFGGYDANGSHGLWMQGADILATRAGLPGYPNKVTQGITTNMQTTLFDSLMLKGKATDNGKATMHIKATFSIWQSASVNDVATPYGWPDGYYGNSYKMSGNDYTNITMSSNMTMTGGRPDSDYTFEVETGAFAASNINGDNDRTEVTESLDFAVELNFLDSTAISIRLSDLESLDFIQDDPYHYPWNGGIGHDISLTFDSISVKDDSGNDLCGITIAKSSGDSWGHTAACQVDGGGDGGNGGSGAGNVPEPASWALMLGGFGLVGGAMRASRRTGLAALR